MTNLKQLILAFVVAAACVTNGCGDRTSADDKHLAKHHDRLADAARQTLTESEAGQRLTSSDLPTSLQLPGLRFAETFTTHINLVTYVTPDTVSGYRIWIEMPSEAYNDRPTPWPKVTRYRYCDDYPQSPENHP